MAVFGIIGVHAAGGLKALARGHVVAASELGYAVEIVPFCGSVGHGVEHRKRFLKLILIEKLANAVILIGIRP